jgi:phosphatidylinositol alpha-mannosyltransferase
MKIGLVLESSLNIPGGVQEYTRGLYDFLEKGGDQVLIISCGEKAKEDRERNVFFLGKVFEIPRLGASASTPLTLGKSEKIQEFLRQEKFDILHFQGPMGILGHQLLNQSETKNILTFLIYHKGLLPFLLAPFLLPGKGLSRKFAIRIAISHVALSLAQKFYPGKYEVVPCGINLSRFKPSGGRMKRFLDGKVNILFVGRLDERKGVLTLLRAFQKISSTLNTRLLIVGDGPYKRKAERLVRSSKLKDVVFLGQVESNLLPYFYRTADIFCAPATHGESFGIVLLEAMASRLPIVAYANEGYKEVLGKGPFSEFLVKPKDVRGLAEKLELLIRDKKLRQKLGEEGLREVQKYSWEKVGERILELYEKALGID